MQGQEGAGAAGPLAYLAAPMPHRLVTLMVCLGAAPALADSADVDDLSLEALLDTRVEVATSDARTALEAPNVVVLLTRDDIVASGSRDLLEVLQLVPGFTFHHDVSGVVGVAFRNLWGHEGKVLVMLDGQEVNELLYSSTQFGHHVLAHTIERLEIIRGPGSALYGGSAELAVINVITRQGRSLQGGEVAGRVAAGGSTTGRSPAPRARATKPATSSGACTSVLKLVRVVQSP